MGKADFYGLIFYMLALIADCVLVFADVYFLALFSDLSTDHIGPLELCRHLNVFVMPEIIGHAVLTVLMIVFGTWWLFVLNLPLLIWNIYRWQKKTHLLDPTQIFRVVSTEEKILFVKLGFYMICFCCYLFMLIRSAIGN